MASLAEALVSKPCLDFDRHSASEVQQPHWKDKTPPRSFYTLFSTLRLLVASLLSEIIALATSFGTLLNRYVSKRSRILAYRSYGKEKTKHWHPSRYPKPDSIPEVVISAVEGVNITIQHARIIGKEDLQVEYQVSSFCLSFAFCSLVDYL